MKTSETRLTRLNVRLTCLNHGLHLFRRPPSSYAVQARYTVRHLYNTHACRKPVMSLFIYLPSKSYSSTRLLRPLIHPPLLFNSLDLPYAAYYPPLFYKGPRLGPQEKIPSINYTIPLFFKKGHTGLDPYIIQEDRARLY